MTTKTKVWNQEIKNVVRKELLKKRGKAFRTALFMPAETAYCVEEAKHSGLIDSQTELILVDRDATTLSLGYCRCVDDLDHQENWIQLRRGKVEDVLRWLRPKDVAVTDGWCNYLEFLYLDTCGELSPIMVDSLKVAVKNKVITNKTTIAFTFTSSQRMWNVKNNNHTAPHFQNRDSSNLLNFSKKDKRNSICQIISNTIRYAIGRPDAEIAFGCAYKERGGGFPMMTGIILGEEYAETKCDNPFADLGYNGNYSPLEP